MKKCSTAAFALSLASAIITAPAAANERCRFLESAPDSHRVVKGDTLWDIASAFLANPWCWPEVWALNRDDIRDPHWIYPGQVIVFDRQQKRLGLAPAATDASAVSQEQRSPAARSEPLTEAPIPAIDPNWQHAASELKIVAGGAPAWPRILGFSESRRIAAAGDTALVDSGTGGLTHASGRHDVVRLLPPIIDPEDGSVLAMPLQRVGQAEFVRTGGHGLALYNIVAAYGELLAGDLLAAPPAVPAVTDRVLRLHPAAPFEGRVAAVLSGGHWAAQRDLVVLNRGNRAGLRAGSLVSVVRHVRIAPHDARNRSRHPQLPAPSKAIATLVVVEALERASLAIVLRSDDAFSVGEIVRSVEATAE